METYKRVNELLGTDYKSDMDLDWQHISRHQDLSENFIREFSDKVYWAIISVHQRLSECVIREFQDRVNWRYISEYQKLSDEFIGEFKNKVNWFYISMYQNLSENFIRKFQNKVDWWSISTYQKLSECFMRDFKNKINWSCISRYQKLSDDFIEEFSDEVEWRQISIYQKLSEDFIGKFKARLCMTSVEGSWHYKDAEFKKQAVVDTGLYECYDDYFIAYKGIRSDRYSHFNFQYKYEPGGIYEAWCDCSYYDNGFGLSAWTEKEAKRYCDELIVRVKVRYEDVGRVVHGGKVRCFRFEVLN